MLTIYIAQINMKNMIKCAFHVICRLQIPGWLLAAAMFVFIHSFNSILAEKLPSELHLDEKGFDNATSERVLKSNICSPRRGIVTL